MDQSMRRESAVAQGCRGGAAGRLDPKLVGDASAAEQRQVVVRVIPAPAPVERERSEAGPVERAQWTKMLTGGGDLRRESLRLFRRLDFERSGSLEMEEGCPDSTSSGAGA